MCNSNEKDLGLMMKSKCIVYVPGCLIFNHVKSSTGFSNRCIKYSLRVKILRNLDSSILPGVCGYLKKNIL